MTASDAARDAAVQAWETHAGLAWETGANKTHRRTVDVILEAAAPHIEQPLRARIEAEAVEFERLAAVQHGTLDSHVYARIAERLRRALDETADTTRSDT